MSPHEGGPSAPAPARRPATLLRLALAAVALLAAMLPGAFLGACMGGTSTDAGNPELVIGFRQDGKQVDFEGIARIYAADSNPAFYTPSPIPARSSKDVSLSVDFDIYTINSYSWLTASPVKSLNRRFLDHAAGYRASLPLLPSHLFNKYESNISAVAGEKGKLVSRRVFNILVDHFDGTSALVEDIAINATADGYVAADGSGFDTLWIDLKRGVGITGTIDTAGLPDKPLILFMPGSPLSAPVQGNRFHLVDAPRIKFPVRMVTRSGLIYAFKEPLDGTRSDAFYADSVLAMVPGDRQDSVDLPDVLPFPAAPVAKPPGPKTFTDTILVTLTAEAGAAIYYTTDGEDPGLQSLRYTGPVRIKATGALRAVAFKQGQNLSPIATNNYVQVPLPPKAAPASQAFRDSVVVSLTTPVMNGVILYTVDGSAPNDSSPAYDRPLVFRTTTTLKSVTSVDGLGLSQVLEEKYILIPDTLGQQ